MKARKHQPSVYEWIGLAFVWMLTSTGCGTGLVAVEGNVTFDGQPVEKGTIVFEPADGKGATTGGEINNGHYELSGDAGAPPGKKIVRITAVRKTGRKIPAGPPEPPDKMVDELKRYIPDLYNTNSTLSCEIVTGQKNQHHFDLKSQ